MATTVGETVSSTEMVVAQFDDVAEGTTVESLMIEFDQAKYEEYLSSSSSSGKALRRCRKTAHVAQPRTTEAVLPKSSTPAMTESFALPKPAGEKAVVVDQPMQPRVEECKVHLDVDHVITIDTGASPSKRVRQRRRQTLARREAAASTSFDGLNYYADQQRAKSKCTAHGCDRRIRTGEPIFEGEPRSGDKVSEIGELGLSAEPHSSSRVPQLGELGKRGETSKSGGIRSLGRLSKSDEPHHEGEPQISQRAEARQSAKSRPQRQPRLNSTLGMPKRVRGNLPQMSECMTHPSNIGGGCSPSTGDLRGYLTRKRTIQEGLNYQIGIFCYT